MTLDELKTAMETSGGVELQVTDEIPESCMAQGETIQVGRVPFRQLIPSDIVLSVVHGRIGLRRLVQAREIYGVPCVQVRDQSGTVHTVNDRAVLGKVFAVRTASGQIRRVVNKPSMLARLRRMFVSAALSGST